MLTDTALKWLERYCISKETAEHFNLTVEEHHFPELECDRKAIRIPYVVNGTVVGSRWVDHKENWTSDLQAPHLWNTDAKQPPTLYICDNELAVMALHGAGVPAICPSDYLKPDLFAEVKYLHDVTAGFEEVVLLFSKQEESVQWERELSRVFARKKAKTTRFPDGCTSVFDLIKSGGVKQCLENKVSLPPHGVHSFGEFWEDIKNLAKGLNFDAYSTGWSHMDQFFKMQLGTINIIHGIPSSGKSEWVDQLMLNMIRNHGWKWLIYSPENYPPSWHFSKLAEKTSMKPLFGSDRIQHEDLVAAMEIVQPNIKLVIPDDREKGVDDVLDAARLSIMKWNINAVLIDPFNSLDHQMRSNENEHQYIGRFLSTMRNFARLNRVWVGIVAHPIKMHKIEQSGEYQVPVAYDLAGSSNWFNKADNIICIYRKMVVPDGVVHAYVQKIKNRWTGQPGDVQFKWHRNTGLFTGVDQYPSDVEFNAG